MGARRGGWQGGHLTPGIRKKDVICKISLNFRSRLRRSQQMPYISVYSAGKNAKFFVCAYDAPNNGPFCVRRAKNAPTFLSVVGFAPFWKNFCGRPCTSSNISTPRDHVYKKLLELLLQRKLASSQLHIRHKHCTGHKILDFPSNIQRKHSHVIRSI